MTLPNKDTRQVQITTRRHKHGQRELFLVFLLCIVASFYVNVTRTLSLVEHHEAALSQKGIGAYAPVHAVRPDLLKHEDLFLKTLKSCLPQKTKAKCKTFVPEETTTERVAVMAPSPELTSSLFRFLQVVIGRAKRRGPVDIELIPTTHMAPYGYGKTQ